LHDNAAMRVVVAISLLCAGGCVETDGPPLENREQRTTPCAAPARQAVPKDVAGAFPPCCNGEAILIPEYLVPKEFRTKLDVGPNQTRCVPLELATDASFTPQACSSVFGLPGACLSPCLPDVRNQDIKLPKDICQGDRVCAPCVHPLTKQETGACKFGLMACTAPPTVDECKPLQPTLDLTQFATCCAEGKAHCAPAELVPGEQQKDLAPCAGGMGGASGGFCVPDDILARGGKHQPASCRSVGGLEGRCISVCVKSVAAQKNVLPRDLCREDERCAPCFDPRSGEPTGACAVGPCDKPKDPYDKCKPLQPTLDLGGYTACCAEGKAHCAPAELVDPAQQKDLAQCAGGVASGASGGFCVPDDILARGGKHQPATCSSVGNVEGRCMSLCIKSVGAKKDVLPQASCRPDERCVPCYDPTTGAGTGACTAGPCDAPKAPPETFKPCGVGATDALCVPAELVPATDRCHFDGKGCQAGCEPGRLCVPRKVVDAGPTFKGKPCTVSMTGVLAFLMTFFTNPFAAFSAAKDYSEGACVSRCLPDVKSNASAKMLSQGSCDADELCIPCYDPTKISQGKVPTGACHRPACP
jgi:hypothetical protein